MSSYQTLLFEEDREAWRDIRSYASVTWQVAALTFGVMGLTANILASGDPPVYYLPLGWFLLLFAAGFLIVTMMILVWAKSKLFARIQFMGIVEDKLKESSAAFIPIVRSEAGDRHQHDNREGYGPIISFHSEGTPISVLVWLFFFLLIAVDFIWIFQGLVVWGLPDWASPMFFVVVIDPALFIIAGFYGLSKDYDTAEPYKDTRELAKAKRRSGMKKAMALWVVMHEPSFNWFWGIKKRHMRRGLRARSAKR